MYHTPREYNQSCNGKQNIHSSQQRHFLHLANHTASRYLLKILVHSLFNHPRRSNYQWYSFSPHVLHSRHFYFQLFIFRELLKLFRWHISVRWDSDIYQGKMFGGVVFDNNIRPFMAWSLVSADWHIPENCYHVIFFSFFWLEFITVSFSFDVIVFADTLVDICSNIVMSGYVLCFSQYWPGNQRLNDRLFLGKIHIGSVPSIIIWWYWQTLVLGCCYESFRFWM